MLKLLRREVSPSLVANMTMICFLALAFLMLFLSGCMSLKKAEDKVIASGRLPVLAAQLLPPVKVFVPGDTIIKTEVKFLPGDTITKVQNGIVYKLIRDTLFQDKTKTIRDTIEVERTDKLEAITRDWKSVMDKNGELTNMVLIKNNELAIAIKRRNYSYLMLSGIILLIGLGLFLRLKKIFI